MFELVVKSFQSRDEYGFEVVLVFQLFLCLFPLLLCWRNCFITVRIVVVVVAFVVGFVGEEEIR